MVATYIVPAGVYEQIEINGRKAIDASSFHYVDQVPVSPWTALLALTGGFVKNAGIIAMITFIAGAIQVINATKCIDASVGNWWAWIPSPAGLCVWRPAWRFGLSPLFS